MTGLFLTFWDRGRGFGIPLPAICNFKTVNAMVTKLREDDVHNNSSNFRCSDAIMTKYDVIYDFIFPILLAERYLINIFITIRFITTNS